jgi:signal transduction histidine kinase
MTRTAIALHPVRRPLRAPSRVELWVIAGVGVAAAASSVGFALTSEAIGPELGEPLVLAFLWVWMTLAYVCGGVIAWSRRPTSRFGPLMIAAGFAIYSTTLIWTSNDVAVTIGSLLDKLPAVLLLHVVLAYPSGQLRAPFDRVLIGTAYVVGVGGELLRMTVGDYGPHNLLEISLHPDVYAALRRGQLLLLSVALLLGVGLLVVRARRAGRSLRLSQAALTYCFGLGLVMVAALYIALFLDLGIVTRLRWATFAAFGTAPVAFLFGLLGARLARSAVGDLVLDLRANPAPAELRGALARALRDPSVTVAYWLPTYGSYTDADGLPVELPRQGGRRSATLIARGDEQVAAIVHDRALDDEPELLESVTAAAGFALENGQLHAELEARIEELNGTRARLLEAGHQERQRLERNLHDGAQQRLVALSVELTLLERRLRHDPDASQRLDNAKREIGFSLEELRDVARGLHPSIVTAHGLTIALKQVAARSTVPVDLRLDIAERLPEPVEVAAYYVVTESLTNVAKYALATGATVTVTRSGSELVVEVTDDGVGGADPTRGSGLRGLTDRVETLGGRLGIDTPAGGGTRVRAQFPCSP